MSKMIIMQGLPASGKSTRAEELVREMGNAVRINKDLLRKMLHFEKFNGRNEGLTRDAARALARTFLTSDVNVIIDDTNLNPGTLQSWKDLAKELEAKVEVCKMDTPYQECIERDRKRQNAVGDHVIYQMAMQNGLLPKQEFVICDIDGTLADATHRLHFLYDDVPNLIEKKSKDWKGFFAGLGADGFRSEVWNQVVKEGADVILVSARPEEYRYPTMSWLADQGILHGQHYKTLIMRKSGDSRDDDIIKREIAERFFAGHTIRKVFDDRPRVIRMWRELGLEVVDVGNGKEF